MHKEGVWQELLHNKYLKNKTLSQVTTKPTNSQSWKGLMKVKIDFLDRGYFKVGNGQNTRFWEDTWLGDTPLSQQYAALYNIVHQKNVLVYDVLSANPLNIEFRRVLSGNNWDAWLLLVQRLMTVTLTTDPDKFIWSLNSSG
jgi:hypothetical protein